MPAGFGGRLRGKDPEHRDLAAQPTQYVISDHGEVITRYDERLLSNTKVSYMYAPGSSPVTFKVFSDCQRRVRVAR
ncbi:hypothetical protein [Streptomyces sp. NPDC050988]|uniref:hypothetical protein n=1 Tax=Streptomyces sp. NPDC050988 TaxID=3365637 RepID=UPI0037944265